MTRMKTVQKRIISSVLAIAMLLSMIRLLPFDAWAADDEYTVFDEGAVLLDGNYSGKNVLIKNGVFSVTVSGAQNVNIMFDSVTMDRRYTKTGAYVSASQDTQNGKTIEKLCDVARALQWGTATGGYRAQVCPLLITNSSSAVVAFRGVNNFYAGTNQCTVSSSNLYTSVAIGGGFAGIQVDAGSTLTIAPNSGTINAYGAYHVPGDNSENSSYKYSDPYGASHNKLAGGAGIGGGALWNTTNSASTGYAGGTPGTIIINGGNVNAFGGHQGAGIGGGVNGAATTSSIIINGGTVNAFGGRWAAGIGDGDSLQENWTQAYVASYQIVINGGTVNATGGVACPAIGATDELSSLSTRKGTSGLEIIIDGGKVTARSGYPDGFNPNGTSGYSGFDAAAAIGAGNKTEMAPASITIGSDAEVIASGFGNYSITEHGTANGGTDQSNIKLPNVKIAPDCYMYLGRFPSLVSSAERTFSLFLPIQAVFNGYTYTKYVTQEKDGSAGTEFYFDAEAIPPLLNVRGEEITNADGISMTMEEIVEKIQRNHLVLDVTADSKEIEHVIAPAFFRSIAMTLPHPQEYGGVYALRVPTGSLTYTQGDDGYELPKSGYITVDITARAHGTVSGELVYPSKGNLLLDLVSDPLTDMDVYQDAAHTDGSNGLIGDSFLNTIYAYNVYIDHAANVAYLYFSYRKLDNFTCELTMDDVLDRQIEERDGYVYVTGRIDMTGLQKKVLYIMKTDKGKLDGQDKQLNAVVYKITVARKAIYTIDLNDPGKTYDGNAVSTRINEVYAGNKTYAVYHALTGTMVEYLSGSFLYTLPNVSTSDGVKSTYGVRLADGTDSILSITSSCTISVSDGIVRYNVLLTVGVADSSTGTLQITGAQTRFLYSAFPREGETPLLSNTSLAKEVAVAYTDESDTNKAFYLRSDDHGRVTIDYMGQNALPLFSLSGEAATTTVTGRASADRDSAEQAAKKALDAGATSGSWSYEMSENRIVTGAQTASVGVCTYADGANTVKEYASYTTNYQRSYTHTEHGRYHISATTGGGYTVFAPTADELARVVYTYYRSDDDGTTWELLTGVPKNAGYYKVVAEIAADTYYASGEKIFEIHRRTLTVTRIQNAMTYVSAKDYAFWTAPHTISQPGELYMDNVVAGDNVTAVADSIYYNNIDIGYGVGKITLDGVKLTGDAEVIGNYRIASTQHVFGQITYSLDGAIFKKEPGKPWDKFYPVDSIVPVDRDSADYHSPADANGVYNAHSDYVYGRTTGDGGEKRIYAVDIEFGSMNFSYSLTVWNVETLQYEELQGESRWAGFDGQANAITVVNRSNAAITYTATSQIDFLHSAIGDTDHGIRAGLYAENSRSSEQVTGKAQTVPAATAGDSTKYGTPGVGQCFLLLSGIPQFDKSDHYIAVGKTTVTITTSSG